MSTVKLLHRKYTILRSFWENLHWTEKIYTGTAGGAGDKYQVWLGKATKSRQWTGKWIDQNPESTHFNIMSMSILDCFQGGESGVLVLDTNGSLNVATLSNPDCKI